MNIIHSLYNSAIESAKKSLCQVGIQLTRRVNALSYRFDGDWERAYSIQVDEIQGVPKNSDTIEIILIVVKPFLTLLLVDFCSNELFKIEVVNVYAPLGFA